MADPVNRIMSYQEVEKALTPCLVAWFIWALTLMSHHPIIHFHKSYRKDKKNKKIKKML